MFDTQEILNADISKLHKMLNILTNNNEQNDQEIHKITKGYKLKIPIYYFTNQWFEIYPNTKRAKIYGYGKLPIEEFYTELNKRETTMRQIILELVKEDKPHEAR